MGICCSNEMDIYDPELMTQGLLDEEDISEIISSVVPIVVPSSVFSSPNPDYQ